MGLSRNKRKLKNKQILEISFLSFLMIILFLIQITKIEPSISINNKLDEHQDFMVYNDNLKIAAEDGILFEGTEGSLNITDYGNLYNPNQEVSLTNEEELNLSYYLDVDNNWKISKIENSISNIQDTRNWINNSGIYPIASFSVDYPLVKNYGYNEDENDNLVTIDAPITAGATAMRVHFVNISFQYYLDYIFIEDENFVQYYIDTGFKEDFFSPWILGDSLRVYIESDNTGPNPGDGYNINYYEYINASSNSQINFNSWGSSNDVDSSVRTTFGSGLMNGSTAFYLGMHGNSFFDSTYNTYRTTYYKGDYIEIYQNISIPRGKLIDAYISFDYYPQFAMDAGNNFLYFAINNQEIYSKTLLEIVDLGRNQWHSTGKYNLELWSNTSNVFDNILKDQQLNISLGIKSKSWTTYSYYVDSTQQLFWFDNISLGVTTIANSTQEGINLTINSFNLFDGNQWGYASRDLIDIPQKDPIILTINTTSPSIKFDLNTTLYGSHKATSKINQQHDEGISYKILENGTIIWEFLHNFYWPPQYSDFEFILEKPLNWKFLYVKDQGNNLRSFEGGKEGDSILKINKTEAVFYGWWSFKASSPNYFNIMNTKILKAGKWVQASLQPSYKTGESVRIKSQVNFSNEIPQNADLKIAYLTIYHPNGTIWHEESKFPDEYGNVIFSEISIGSYNTSGGVYNYTIFWSNGTALGGLKSNFLIIHESFMNLLRPTDALSDLIADGFVGDFIPLRIQLKDSENNLPISNAQVTHNWTGGQNIVVEDSGNGIYDAIIETETLGLGIYKIIVNSSITGFVESNLTLTLNLGENTKLQRLEYDYYIEFHANTTIKFQYLNSTNGGIDGAVVKVNISNPSWYTINNTGEGIYAVEINTTFVTNVGYFYLNINFTKGKYESQERTYQFEIVEQTVNLTVLLNAQGIKENSLFESKFNEEITVKARSMAKYDRIYLSGGNFTFICGDYEVNLTKSDDYWFNNSIKILTTYFSLGYNYAYIKFSMDNYQTTVFPFQMIIGQIPIEVLTIDFDNSIDAYVGQDISIEIQLKEVGSNIYIDGASVSYSWKYGVGTLDGKGSGIYELNLEIPDDIEEDDYKVTLIISKEEYKSTEFSFIVDVTQEQAEEDPLLFWIIISILIAVIGVLAVLSYRSYVLLPRRRRKESDLLARTQRFKDLQNIQAVVIIHKSGGVPVYLKSYSILEHQKKELFSGFIQAITTIGEELSDKKTVISEEEDLKKDERVLEIDFKHFYCLIADKGDIRAIFILKEKSSERLRNLVKKFSLYLHSKLKDRFALWDGSLDEFEKDIPPILNEYFELFYKEPCQLTKPDIIAKIRKENELNSMELRILNVIYSLLKGKGKTEFYLDRILELVHEENKDLIIDSIETLIGRKIIIPSTDEKYKSL